MLADHQRAVLAMCLTGKVNKPTPDASGVAFGGILEQELE